MNPQQLAALSRLTASIELAREIYGVKVGRDLISKVSPRGMLSVPYSVELNDLSVFLARGLNGPDFVGRVRDQLDQLYADSASSGRVMALALHPFVIGQPFRTKYLDQALTYVASHPGVWVTTADEIAEHYERGS